MATRRHLTDADIGVTVAAAGAGGATESLTKSITQTGHGFVVGDILRHNGTSYVKAQADTPDNSEMVGMVSTVTSANVFVLSLPGSYVSGLTGLTAGASYFLSPTTAGTMTATEPTTLGQVSKPVFNADTTTGGYLINLRGIEIVSTDTDITSTDNAAVRFDGTTGTLQNSAVLINDGGSVTLPVVASPTVSPANSVNIFGRSVAGRMMVGMIGTTGIITALQPFLGRNKVGLWSPPGNATTVPGVTGITAPTVTGFTATARTVATTNMFTRTRRLGYVTAATAAAIGQWRQNVDQFTLGDGAGLGGFKFIITFGISDAAPATGARMFMGMRTSSSTAPTNVEPSTLTNCIGIGHGAADTNLFLYYGGSTAQTPINLGANFPAITGSVDIYELTLFASPFVANTINYEVSRLNTGNVATGTITGGATVIPQSTSLMGYWGYRTNNATARAVAIDVMQAYIETDQ